MTNASTRDSITSLRLGRANLMTNQDLVHDGLMIPKPSSRRGARKRMGIVPQVKHKIPLVFREVDRGLISVLYGHGAEAWAVRPWANLCRFDCNLVGA